MVPASQVAPPPPAAAADDELIKVTGSRIGRNNLEGFSHVTVLSAKDINLTGVTSVDEIIRRLPTVTLGGINKNNNNAGDGLAWIELRNLGVSRTLVLVNGRRFVSATSGVSEAVDLNNIPMELIDRVEVLLDGASAIYGSDAVAGVINIILKDDFEGLSSSAYAGISQHGDSETLAASATMGSGDENGHVIVSANVLVRDEIKQRDRDWARESVVGAEFDPDGNIIKTIGSGATPAGVANGQIFLPDPTTGRSYQPASSSNRAHRFSYADDQYLVGQQRRMGLSAFATRELASDTRAFLEASVTHRTSERQLATEPLGTASTVNFENGFTVPITNPYWPADFLASLDPGVDRLEFTKRPTVAGPRNFEDSFVNYRGVLGVEGKLLERFDWEAYINYGRNLGQSIMHNAINLAKAMETADPMLCAQNASRGCVVGDWIGTGLQPEVVDYITYDSIERKGIEQFSSGFTLGGPLVPLIDAPLGVALGGIFRHEGGFTFQDGITAGGDAAGNGFEGTEGGYYGVEGFLEVELPLLRHRAFAEDLTVNLAGRFSHFSSFGNEPTFRAALTYAPSKDLRLRSTYSTAFRAPSISDLYGGAVDSFETFNDPCNDWDTSPNTDASVRRNCQAAGVPGGYNQTLTGGSQIRTNIGGNSELEAETAKVVDVGVVLSPQFLEELKGLAIALDYYWVRVDNAIENPPGQYLLDSCFASDNLSGPSCDAIRRSPTSGRIQLISASVANIGRSQTSGVDMSVGYALPLRRLGFPNMGTFDVMWRGNYLIHYNSTVQGDTVRYGGTVQPRFQSYANLRWSLSAALSGDRWTLRTLHRYLGGGRNFNRSSEQPYHWIEPVLYWDLAFQYRLSDLDLTVGCENVLNQEPPFFLEGNANADPNSYDFVGRFFYVRAGYRY